MMALWRMEFTYKCQFYSETIAARTLLDAVIQVLSNFPSAEFERATKVA